MIAYVFQKYPENFIVFLIFCSNLPKKLTIFLESSLPFNSLSSFPFKNKTLWLNNLKTRTDMNVIISVFVICVEAIINLLLYNLHDHVNLWGP